MELACGVLEKHTHTHTYTSERPTLWGETVKIRSDIPGAEKIERRFDCNVQTEEGNDKYDREDLIVRDEWTTTGHRKKLKKGTCKKDTKKFNFPHWTVEGWNALDRNVIETTAM